MVATAETLIAQARAETGFTDLGADSWQEGLDQMLRAVETDVHDPDAVARIERILTDRLVLRLRIEDWYAHHGDEAVHPVESPLFIVGLPRTATTAIHYLLSLDPQLRYLRTWERDAPLPPPDPRTEDTDPRRKSVERSEMHIRTVDGPAEDGPLQMLDFRSGHALPLPTYKLWWESTRHPTGLAYQDRVLRLLHSHRPPYRWLLKYPDYAFQLDELVDLYPDAKFIWTHRDPLKVIPSTCSVMVDGTRRRIPDWEPDDWSAFGHSVLDRFSEAARRASESRAKLGDGRFLDVGQPEMDADPVVVGERIHDFAGLPVSAELRQAMADWAESNRRGSRGAHVYSAEQYGLTDDEIREAFADYLRDYGAICSPDI